MAKTNIINKGVHCKVRVYGSGLTEGKSYTACLYYSANNKDNRAEVEATAATTDSAVQCVFDFTPEQTTLLKAGKAILEVYDTGSKQQMVYDDDFATVRSTSLSK